MRGHVRSRSGDPRSGVLVSDGVTVTATAADGSFTLDPRGPFVFVTRPAGYDCEDWYLPADTPALRFILDPAPEPFPYRFVHVSDLHVSAGPRAASRYPRPVEIGTRDALAAFLGRLPELEPGLSSVVATGDLTDLGLDEEYAALQVAAAGSPLPLHLLPGNHDHMAGEISRVLTRTGYALHTGDPAGYERHLGPRWYSFDLPGLHVVALDWHTHELGLDHEVQDAWLRADLESQPAGTPWILLCHDQPWHTILDGLPTPPLATFSGHRHTSRVVRVGLTLHVNTPTPLFGALDFSPPSLRVVTWDGAGIALRTRTVAASGSSRATFSMPSRSVARPKPARWRHQLPGGGHRAAVRVVDDLVLAAVRDEDRPAGGVDAVDLANGTLRWRAPLRSAVKGTPAVCEDIVVAVEVSGDTVGLGLADGALRWRVPSPDPLRLFAFAEPLAHDGAVVVGDLSHLRALDAATGALRWERTDLAAYQTIVGHAAPVVADGALVVGCWPAPPHLVSLDPASGTTRWPSRIHPRDRSAAVMSGEASIGTPLVDGKTGDLFVSGLGFLARVDATSGAVVWRRPMTLPWNPASPVATDPGIAAADAGHGIVLLDRDSGERIWSTPLDGPAPFALSSYRRTPHTVFAAPTPLDDVLLVPGLDSVLHLLVTATGERIGGIEVGVPIAAPVVVAGDAVVATGVDGGVLALDRAACR